MISLDDVSWHPYYVPKVERPKLDRVSTHEILDNQHLPSKTKTNGKEVVTE